MGVCEESAERFQKASSRDKDPKPTNSHLIKEGGKRTAKNRKRRAENKPDNLFMDISLAQPGGGGAHL